MSIIRGDDLELWNYSAIWGCVCAGSARLAEAGVEHGDRVGILGETEPAWGVTELATLHRGAIAVPLDPNHPDGVLRAILEDAGATAIVVSASLRERGRELLPGGVLRSFDELFDRHRDAGGDFPPADVEPDHPRLLVYTSGTTGDPKGVTLTERNLASQIDIILKAINLNERDMLLSILPLNHMFAQIVNLIGPMYIGASVRFAGEATPQGVRAALARGGVTAFGAVPQFFSLFRDRVSQEIRARGSLAALAYRTLLKLSRGTRRLTGWNPGRFLFPAIHRAFGGHLRWVVSGGAHIDPELARQLVDWGFELLIAYGLTEATAGVTVTPPGDVDVTTVGRAMPGLEVRIDRPNPEGIGEIMIRGDTVMAGYWNRPEATAAILDEEGWLRSGDLGLLDGKGNLVIRGRAREMIVLASGKNVFPEELDQHYAQHELIQEVCVVGLPEEGGGERLHAVVVPDLDEFRRQAIPTVEDYIRFEMESLALELPSYQRVLSYTIWREPLPRTPTRKVRRFEVRRRLLEEQVTRPVAARKFELTEADRELLDSPAMRAAIEAGRLHERGIEQIHPDMSLEFDFGLDSLVRAEMLAHLASRYGIDPDSLASALTLREMVEIVETSGSAPSAATTSAASLTDALDDPEADREAERRLPDVSGWRALRTTLAGVGMKALVKSYFKLNVVGRENLPHSDRPYVLAVNHASFGDPFFVAAALPNKIRRDVFYIGHSDHLQGWLRSAWARALQVIPVDPGRRLAQALKLGAAGLRRGRILMIFPEGERTYDGRLREFKPGTALLIRQTRTPAIPVAIVGAHEVWGRHRDRPRRGRITVAFGEPIDFGKEIGDNLEADQSRITGILRERIAGMIADHGGPPAA